MEMDEAEHVPSYMSIFTTTLFKHVKQNTKLKPKQVCSGLVRWISTKTFGAKLGELSSIPGTRY